VDTSLFPLELARDAAARAVDAARALGATAAVAISAGEGLSVTLRNGELETIEHHRDKSLAITIYRGGSKGSASSTDFGAEAIAATVAAADAIARHAEADPYAGLIAPEYLARDIPDLDLDHPWEVDVAAATALAKRADAAAAAADPRIAQIDDTSVSRYRGYRVYANSDGFLGAYTGTRHGLSCTAVASANGAMQRGYWYTAARDATQLEAPEAVGATAAARTVAKLGARKLKTCTAAVLFESRIAGGLVGHLLAAASGHNLYREASFLRGRLGERVMPAFVTIREEPHLRGALGSAPFDGEGVATRDRDIVAAGVLNTYLLDGYSARRLKMEPTGHSGGTHNLTVSDQGDDFEAMLKKLDRGLLVTELMGFGINLVTGDYSRGASGFWVENGAIQYPVEEITIAGTLQSMYLGIVATGADLDLRGSTRSGSILVDAMTIAGD
jgi:PmbA protein